MKLNGKKIDPPGPVKLVFFRETEKVELVLGPILNYDVFDKMVPLPKPPSVYNVKTQKTTVDYNDKKYDAKLDEYSKLRTAWSIITSLSATPGLDWETVNPNEPDTWVNWTTELQESFTELEMNRILQATQDASMPTEKRYKEALDSFTRSQAEQVTDTSSLKDVQPVTQSGESANASV